MFGVLYFQFVVQGKLELVEVNIHLGEYHL